MLIGVALVMLEPSLRRLARRSAAVAGDRPSSRGRLLPVRCEASLTQMDDVWLQAVASKDSLFALAVAGVGVAANLALLARALVGASPSTARAAHATPRTTALALGRHRARRGLPA